MSSAPVPDPLPLMLKGSGTVKLVPSKWTAPVELTLVPVPEPPSAFAWEILAIPADTVVRPV